MHKKFTFKFKENLFEVKIKPYEIKTLLIKKSKIYKTDMLENKI